MNLGESIKKSIPFGPENEVIYISGPMTGKENFGRPVFLEAEKALTEMNYRVINPAWLPMGMTYEQYMSICMPMVAAADVIVMLPGWEASKGSLSERAYAEALKKKIIEVNEGI